MRGGQFLAIVAIFSIGYASWAISSSYGISIDGLTVGADEIEQISKYCSIDNFYFSPFCDKGFIADDAVGNTAFFSASLNLNLTLLQAKNSPFPFVNDTLPLRLRLSYSHALAPDEADVLNSATSFQAYYSHANTTQEMLGKRIIWQNPILTTYMNIANLPDVSDSTAERYFIVNVKLAFVFEDFSTLYPKLQATPKIPFQLRVDFSEVDDNA